MNGIKQYSIDLISELDKLSMKASNVLNNQSIGQCPKCNDGNIYPGKKAYYCSNYSVKENPCNFQIFKTISNKKITGNMARQLIEKKKTEMLKFKDDNNRQFEANIILKEDDFTATLMVL